MAFLLASGRLIFNVKIALIGESGEEAVKLTTQMSGKKKRFARTKGLITEN